MKKLNSFELEQISGGKRTVTVEVKRKVKCPSCKIKTPFQGMIVGGLMTVCGATMLVLSTAWYLAEKDADR